METERPLKKQRMDNQEDTKKCDPFVQNNAIAIMDDVINAADEYLCDGIDQVEAALMQQVTSKAEQTAVTEGLDKLTELLQARTAKGFDLLELYVLQNIFKLAPGVTSAEDVSMLSPEERQAHEKKEAKVDEDILECYRKLAQANVSRAKAKAELKAGQVQLSKLQSLFGEDAAEKGYFDLVSVDAQPRFEKLIKTTGAYLDVVTKLDEFSQNDA